MIFIKELFKLDLGKVNKQANNPTTQGWIKDMSSYHSTQPPKARVNITLELNSNGQKKKKELPMKLLVLGHFSGGDDTRKIADRPHYSVNKRTFNTLMARVLPTLH